MTTEGTIEERTMTTDAQETYTPARIKRWTMPESYFGAVWPDYYSAGVGRSRESSDLEQSNFETMLRDLGGRDRDRYRSA